MIFDVLKYRRLGRGRDEGMGEKRKKIYEALVEAATGTPIRSFMNL
jgi:hypothetical protein